MLLVDRLVENAVNHSRRCLKRNEQPNAATRVIVDCLPRIPVFEASNVINLGPDWDREKDRAVSRNPPAEVS